MLIIHERKQCKEINTFVSESDQREEAIERCGIHLDLQSTVGQPVATSRTHHKLKMAFNVNNKWNLEVANTSLNSRIGVKLDHYAMAII